MDINEIVSIVSSLGFPIVMCLLFFKYIRELQAQHREESNKMAEAINNNTLTMQKLVDTLEREEEADARPKS